jgi:hypothetical protein
MNPAEIFRQRKLSRLKPSAPKSDHVHMKDTPPTICFTCGMPAGAAPGAFPRLNTLGSGQPCPTCRDRLLESLPGIFPGGSPSEVDEPSDPSEAEDSGGLPSHVAWGPRWSDEPDEPA